MKCLKFKFILFTFLLVQISFSQVITNNKIKYKVLNQLNLNENEIDNNLYNEKVLPYNKAVSVVVVPKIASKEADVFIEFDAYILLVNNSNGAIISKYYQPKAWLIDAIYISSIDIDTAKYQLNSKVKAFGIRVNYRGSSRANPYYETILSLYTQNGKNLNCVLNNYSISKNTGEWDTNCAGQFENYESVIIIDKSVTNKIKNLKVKQSNVIYKNVKIGEDCEEKIIKENVSFKKLIFNGLEYK